MRPRFRYSGLPSRYPQLFVGGVQRTGELAAGVHQGNEDVQTGYLMCNDGSNQRFYRT